MLPLKGGIPPSSFIQNNPFYLDILLGGACIDTATGGVDAEADHKHLAASASGVKSALAFDMFVSSQGWIYSIGERYCVARARVVSLDNFCGGAKKVTIGGIAKLSISAKCNLCNDTPAHKSVCLSVIQVLEVSKCAPVQIIELRWRKDKG